MHVSFIDSDDYIELVCIEKPYKAFTDNRTDVVKWATRYFSEDGAFDMVTALQMLRKEKDLYHTIWNKLWRKEMISGVLFAKGKYNEDEFWICKIVDGANKIVPAITNEVLIYARFD